MGLFMIDANSGERIPRWRLAGATENAPAAANVQVPDRQAQVRPGPISSHRRQPAASERPTSEHERSTWPLTQSPALALLGESSYSIFCC